MTVPDSLPLPVVAVLLALVAIAVGAVLSARRPASREVEVDLRGRLEQAERARDALQDRLTQAEVARGSAETRAAEVSARVSETFKALAADALNDSREQLLKSAEQVLKDMRRASQDDREEQRTEVESIVKPLRDALDAYKREAAEIEQRRAQELGSVKQQYVELSAVAASLRDETAKLHTALRSPAARGRWGQLTLRRTAELAGMASHCDFYEQETLDAEGRRLRPDMLVRLPTDRLIVVDSKVPLDGYLDSLNSTSDVDRDSALVRHARQTREHVTQLGSKDYQAEFERAPDFVVCFIPNDSILAAAVDRDPNIVEYALSRNVVLATPSTFFALLRSVAYGWRQEQIAQNLREVNDLGQRLAERLITMVGHLDELGGALRRAIDAYNKTVGSLESRVLPTARRFRSLGVGSRDVPSPMHVDVAPRSVTAPTFDAGTVLFPAVDDPSSDSISQGPDADAVDPDDER